MSNLQRVQADWDGTGVELNLKAPPTQFSIGRISSVHSGNLSSTCFKCIYYLVSDAAYCAMDELFNSSFENVSSEIPLWEETMRRLASLSSDEAFTDEYSNTVDITQTIFSTPKPFCDALNSEGNSPASSLDDSEKPKQISEVDFKNDNNISDNNNNNGNDLNNLQCSYLSHITSEEIMNKTIRSVFKDLEQQIPDSNHSVEESVASQGHEINRVAMPEQQTSYVECSVNLGQKIDGSSANKSDRDICLKCRTSKGCRTRPCSVVLHNIFFSGDAKTRTTVRRLLQAMVRSVGVFVLPPSLSIQLVSCYCH